MGSSFCRCLLGSFEGAEEGGIPALELLSVLQCSLERGVLLSIEGDEESFSDESFSDFVVEGKGYEGS